MYSTPAHKQLDPSKQAGQIVNHPAAQIAAAVDKPAQVAEALPKFVAAVQALVNAHYAANFKCLSPARIEIDDRGIKYARITTTDSGGGKSVYCFVDLSNGDVLKAAGWKAPAKHARGNILSDDLGMSGVTPYGAKYL